MDKTIKRIVKFGRKVWSLLTEEEQVRYYNVDGTYQFVEYIVDILGLYDFDWTNIELVETIHNKIFK